MNVLGLALPKRVLYLDSGKFTVVFGVVFNASPSPYGVRVEGALGPKWYSN